MTVAGVQARMESIETRFSPKPFSPATAGSGADFAALLERSASRPLESLGSANRFARSPSSGQDLLGSGNAMIESGLIRTTGLDLFTGIPGGVGLTGTGAVAQGLKHLGTPYLWGGTDPGVGLDCSALVQHAYRDIGVELPRVSQDQAKMGVEVASIEAALPGDLVAFGSPVDHIALYVGNGKILHAPRSGETVQVSEISRPIATIRRVVSAQPVGLTTAASRSGSVGPGSVAETRYQALFEQAGRRHGVDPALLAAVASVESGFNPVAQSPVGAKGLMQFMPATAAEMGIDPLDPASAIDGAARYLKREIDRFGSIELAAAAYNAGAGAVSRYGGVPPYTETQNYVKKVVSAYEARR